MNEFEPAEGGTNRCNDAPADDAGHEAMSRVNNFDTVNSEPVKSATPGGEYIVHSVESYNRWPVWSELERKQFLDLADDRVDEIIDDLGTKSEHRDKLAGELQAAARQNGSAKRAAAVRAVRLILRKGSSGSSLE